MKIKLECEFESIEEMNEFMEGIKSNPIETKKIISANTVEKDNKPKKTKSQKKSKKGYKKGISIKDMKDFKKLRKTRVYNRRTKEWNAVGVKGHPMYLPFDDLIKIIEDYRKGVPIEETYKKTNTKHQTASALMNIQYIYRAGGFNEGIYENARRYNYRPEELISHEGD